MTTMYFIVYWRSLLTNTVNDCMRKNWPNRKRAIKYRTNQTKVCTIWIRVKQHRSQLVCSKDCRLQMSRDTRLAAMWYVRPAKAQTSLRIRAVWSELLLVVWIFYTCQNATLLEITCHGSYVSCYMVSASIREDNPRAFIIAKLYTISFLLHQNAFALCAMWDNWCKTLAYQ